MAVDVASGAVDLDYIEVDVPGKLSLSWKRHFRSVLLDRPPSLLGLGWTSPYFVSLAPGVENFEFITPTGDREVFANDVAVLEAGGRVRNLPAFMELFRERGRYIVRRWDIDSGEVRRYCFVADPSRARWPLASIEDLSGQALDLTWNPDGSLAAVRQRLEQRSLSFTYAGGHIESVRLNGKRGASSLVARYEYDSAARLLAAYDAADSADRYRYDTANRLLEESAKDGGVFFFTYDRDGRCIRSSGLDRYDEKSLRILVASRWTEVTNSLGHTTRYQWTAAGQIVTEVNPRGGTRKTTYDSFARVASITDELGNKTTYEYDDDGNRCRIIDALGQVHATKHNEHHQPIEYTDSAGNSWHLLYDDAHRLVASRDPEGAQTVLTYDDHGNLVEATDPLGKRKQYRFDAQGTLQAISDWEDHHTVYEPDDFGRLSGRSTLGVRPRPFTTMCWARSSAWITRIEPASASTWTPAATSWRW